MPTETQEALLQMGSEAVPCLVNWIRYERPFWKSTLLAFLNRITGHQFQDRKALRAERAAAAIRILGLQAKEGVPTLALLMNDRHHSNIALRAQKALAGLAAKVLEADLVFTTNRSVEIRREAIANVGSCCGTEIGAAVPSLLHCLEDTNYLVAVEAARVLSLARSQASIIVPALLERLSDPRPGVRIAAIQGLWEFHAEADPAVPALTALLKDPDPRISRLATDALEVIGRSVAEQRTGP